MNRTPVTTPAARTPRRLVLGAIPDLMLATRVQETATTAGVDYANVPLAALVALACARLPALVVLDLAAPGDPSAAIRALRAAPGLARTGVLGFYPHVHDRLRVDALAAGATIVLPRSAFVSQLAAVLAGRFPAPRGAV